MNQTHIQNDSMLFQNKNIFSNNFSKINKKNDLVKTKIDFLHQNEKKPNNDQNKQSQAIRSNSIEEYKAIDIDLMRRENSQNNIYYKMRTNTSNKYDLLKMYNNNNTVKFQKKEGLFLSMKNHNSIIKNGKIIYNIDINDDTEDEKQSYLYSNSNIILNKNSVSSTKNLFYLSKLKNNVNNKKKLVCNKNNKINNSCNKIIKLNKKYLSNNQTVNTENFMKPKQNVPNYFNPSNKNMINTESNLTGNNINNIIDKENNSIYQSKELKSNQNSLTYSEIIADRLFRSNDENEKLNNNQKQNSHIISQIYPDKAIQSFHSINDEYNIQGKNPKSLLKIMTEKTIDSLYQNNEIKHQINSNLLNVDTSGKINSEIQIQKENNYLPSRPSQLMCETIVSIYDDPNSNLKESENPLLKINPGETVKSFYEDHQSFFKSTESNNH